MRVVRSRSRSKMAKASWSENFRARMRPCRPVQSGSEFRATGFGRRNPFPQKQVCTGFCGTCITHRDRRKSARWCNDRLFPVEGCEWSGHDRDQRWQRPVGQKIFERGCARAGQSKAAQNSELLDSAAAIRFHKSRYAPVSVGHALHTEIGENPPDGAMIDYFLSKDASGPVTIEIKDGKGQLVRKFSSADAPVQASPKRLRIPSYWIRPPQSVSTKAGMHRFLWDMHYTPRSAKIRQMVQ